MPWVAGVASGRALAAALGHARWRARDAVERKARVGLATQAYVHTPRSEPDPQRSRSPTYRVRQPLAYTKRTARPEDPGGSYEPSACPHRTRGRPATIWSSHRFRAASLHTIRRATPLEDARGRQRLGVVNPAREVRW